MGTFENLIKWGKKYGVEYEFFDNDNLRNCKCGGRPRIYIRHTREKLSFGHGAICCPICAETEVFTFDTSGHANVLYKRKDEAIKCAIEEWNNKQNAEEKMTIEEVIESIEKNMWRELESRNIPEEQPEKIGCTTLGEEPQSRFIDGRKSGETTT